MAKPTACLALLCLTMLAGCSTEIDSTVSVVTTLPATSGGKTIAILPANPKTDGAEFRAFAAKLGSHLEKAGYRLIQPADERPDYVAVFGYGIDRGTQVTRTVASPVYGVTGYSQSSMGSSTGRTPIYGITGYQDISNTSEIYKGALMLDIFDVARMMTRNSRSSEDARVYQARLNSSGRCASLAGIMDPLLKALFQDFPGKNARAHPVTVYTPSGNCGR